MSLARQLLDVATGLAMLDRKRPRQASLRRSISTAYYALFHLLVQSAVEAQVGGTANSVSKGLRHEMSRWYDHKQMATTCGCFAGPSIGIKRMPGNLGPISTELQNVARTFRELQESRHTADYDVGAPPFQRQDVLTLIQQTEQAFADWDKARVDPWRPAFLLLLLTGEKIIKDR